MSYEPLETPDRVAVDAGAEGIDGSETDFEAGKKDSDETLSFLRWKLKGDAPNSNPARSLSKRGADRLLAATCSLLPWIINLILMISLIILAWKLHTPNPCVPGSDLMYSKLDFTRGISFLSQLTVVKM